MRRQEIATCALLIVLLLSGCIANTRDVVYSQPQAISADIDASLHHGSIGSGSVLDIR